MAGTNRSPTGSKPCSLIQFYRRTLATPLGTFLADYIGTRRITTTPVADELMEAWEHPVRRILDVERTETPRVLHLDPAALEAYDAYRGALEPTLKSEGRDMQGWLSKLAGTVLRVAGLLHIAVHQRPETARISAATIESAISIGTYFHHHARMMFRLMYGRNGQSEAGAVLEVLRSVDGPRISKRDLYQMVKRRADFRAVESLNGALAALEEYGWIRRERHTGPNGGRPSETIFLHPERCPQNPQNLGIETTTERNGGIGGLPGKNGSLDNVRHLHAGPLDPTGTHDDWSMDL